MRTKPPMHRNYVTERYVLPDWLAMDLRKRPEPFEDPFAEFVYYRTYSRTMKDGRQERWADTVIRVVEGVLSIRKQHYHNNNIVWDQKLWNQRAVSLALTLFDMKWLPPGRGLWAMGTDYLYERGAMCLYNCAFTELRGDSLAEDCGWLMDCLMNGVGVGFKPVRDDFEIYLMPDRPGFTVTIGDDREGWVESVVMLIQSYTWRDAPPVTFDYSQIRPEGEPIMGFGGTASGPKPLEDLHDRIHWLFQNERDVVKLKTDLANAIGCCVVAGNIRRSAEIGVMPISDPTFKNLKDYGRYADRADIGHMSNNSVILESPEDFERIYEIADRVRDHQDLGFMNIVNTKRGRIGFHDPVEVDPAVGLNPCGEIPLEHREVCNVAETLPTRCKELDDWLEACVHATFYCSTVSLLPTHQATTNAMILKNRRIGVSIIDLSGWKHKEGVTKVTRALRKGYELIRRTNHRYAAEAGVPDALRVTTIKPGGTTPKIASRTSGIGHPTFRHTLMNIRVAKRWPGCELLKAAGIPYEDLLTDPETTYVFSFPVLQGPAKPATEVSLWEQALNLVLVQREWADNAVSNTLFYKPRWKFKKRKHNVTKHSLHTFAINYFFDLAELLNAYEDVWEDDASVEIIGPEQKIRLFLNEDTECVDMDIWDFDPRNEEDDLEAVLGHIAPLTKSVALLPHTMKGAFDQMPQQGITAEEYDQRVSRIKQIDWSQLQGSDGMDEKFCTKESCMLEKHE